MDVRDVHTLLAVRFGKSSKVRALGVAKIVYPVDGYSSGLSGIQ
jgi:hypothetical protein